ncbi:MAG: alpha/beta hydrolase [Paracoccaceae bacterium]
MRSAFARIAGEGPEGRTTRIRGIRAVCHGTGPAALWLHGGGYVFGSPETHATAAAFLARESGMTIILPDYRLAPEHTWPAPLKDVFALLDDIERPIPLIGDSAGGHLVLNAARYRPDAVSALVAISANTDRTGLSTSRQAGQDTNPMNNDEDDISLARMSMPDLPFDHPDASPILADLSGLPPTFVTASTREVLLDDSLMLIRALGLAGVPVSADITDAPCHMWTLWPDRLASASMTLKRIAAFLNTHTHTERTQ